MPTFKQKLENKWNENKFICVGLDSSDYPLIQRVVDETAETVASYKINSAFFEEEGVKGLTTLKRIIQYIKEKYPDIPVIVDAKRGDIGNTNEAYAKAFFDDLGADGVTVHPYLGKESLTPFLKRETVGIFVLVRTSNPGAGEFQDLEVEGKPLYQVVAEHVKEWNTNENLAVVVGATYPEELKAVREIIGDMPILVPGIGAQGGDLEKVLRVGLNSEKQGLLIASSRAILNSENPKQAAEDLDNQIKEILKNV